MKAQSLTTQRRRLVVNLQDDTCHSYVEFRSYILDFNLYQICSFKVFLEANFGHFWPNLKKA